MLKLSIPILLLFFVKCFGQKSEKELVALKKQQDDIIKEHVYNCADKINYGAYIQEYQECLDNGLKKDSTIAYLWQQKAMPYFKARKYDIGMAFQDKAVQYDKSGQLPYRAFIKCIFAKKYNEAIIDFEECKKSFGNNYVMDHTFDFYIALCKLQLNKFAEAEVLLKNYTEDMYKKNGEDWVHPTALFYYGISKFEQRQWLEAITIFDKAINNYKQFSEAKYYKAICLLRLKQNEKAEALITEAKADHEKGYALNEDNAIYEKYPYQLLW